MVSIHRPPGYEPGALPLRQLAVIEKLIKYDVLYI
jgi:hypothetical protein